MSNVLKFPTAKPVEVPVESTANNNKLPSNTMGRFLTCLAWAWLVVRLPLFFVLYWLRMPVSVVCNFLSIGCMFGLIVAYFVAPVPKMLWAFGITSFVAFVVMWTYDYVLMALSPEPMMRSL
ncbi:hypothetical protein [Undibacterium sp.]|uniref:hypothetical protein n=1 Tax=Undibacterium sp. TaxID=1914977 RepID=UPI00374FF8B3